MTDEDKTEETADHTPEPGFRSTQHVAATLEDDLQRSFESQSSADFPAQELATPTLTALALALREQPTACEALIQQTEAHSSQDDEIQTLGDSLDALVEIGLQTVAPQYAVVLQDARQQAENDT